MSADVVIPGWLFETAVYKELQQELAAGELSSFAEMPVHVLQVALVTVAMHRRAEEQRRKECDMFLETFKALPAGEVQ